MKLNESDLTTKALVTFSLAKLALDKAFELRQKHNSDENTRMHELTLKAFLAAEENLAEVVKQQI